MIAIVCLTPAMGASPIPVHIIIFTIQEREVTSISPRPIHSLPKRISVTQTRASLSN
jgi:hypothetical protein